MQLNVNTEGMIESDPVNVKESYGNQQTSVEYVNNHQHDQQNLSPEENPTNSHELKLYKFLDNVKQKIDQLSEFCKVMSKDTEEIVGGEGKEQSITMNKESANLINCIYDSSLKTFAVTIKEKMKVEKSDFNCDGEVSTLLNASKDVNDLEIELDNLKDTNGLFKKVLEVIRRLALEKDEKDEEPMVEVIESTCCSSSSDFSFTALQNRVATSSPVIPQFHIRNDATKLQINN